MEKQMLDHVKTMFGWHGGVGDPPSDDAVLAVIRGTKEFLETKDGVEDTP